MEDQHRGTRLSKILSHAQLFVASMSGPAALFLCISWVLSVFFFFVFLKNSGWIPSTPDTLYDLAYLIVSLVFFVLPFVSRLKLGNVLELERTRPIAGTVPKEEVRESPPEEKPKTPIELKILNTLWSRQVLRFPDLDRFWTFKLNSSSPEFLQFREAGNRLMGEGLIDETDMGQFRLTRQGLGYCAEHYREFPDEMWFQHIPPPEENLRKVVEMVK